MRASRCLRYASGDLLDESDERALDGLTRLERPISITVRIAT
jgi:hypothetical protein